MTRDSLVDRVADAFDEDGPLARAFEAFEPRPGQRRLAAEVARLFVEGGTLVAEAGTGTGKTLAYLVPAVLAGRRVLVSTGTRTLQDQVFHKDVPALARALGIEIRAAYLKGRSNFLCRHRFERLREAEAGLTPSERIWLNRIAEWSGETATGDRAEIEDLPDDLALWQEVSATSEQCLGRECPQYGECFVTRMRDRAAESDVVIVNHHLLCADASVRQSAFGEVIPECDLAIIDEAHQLEDVVTHYFGTSISTFRTDDFVRDATDAARFIEAERGRFGVAVVEAVRDVQNAARGFFDAARLELRRSGADRTTVAGDVAMRLADPGLNLRDAFARLAGLVKRETEVPSDLAAIATRAESLAADLGAMLVGEDDQSVRFVEMRGRGVFFRAAPIQVGQLVREAVLGGRHATVLTSATLTVEASFDYVQGRLGLEEAETLALPSEFDFSRQTVLYLPPDMPDPRSTTFNEAAASAIVAILARTRGRAFVLFTSYAAMRDAHARTSGHVDWPTLVQGTAPRSVLLRDFRVTPNAVLFATSSFWQGVDVAGDALSCVIVDRLPFASPADPLVAARIANIDAHGGNAFRDYQVPLATLTLLQGLGRLIRTRSDRGVLAVLDPRLTRMPYGRRFLASIPPAPITDDLDVVERFLAADG
jgi:ATP-dependent DNA helicase DinG